MIRFASQQTIARSTQDVWAYAADILRHPEWMGVLDARLVSGQPTEIGARGQERVKLGPRKFDVGIEVSESIPAQGIAWRMSGATPFAGEVTSTWSLSARIELERSGQGRSGSRDGGVSSSH